MFIITAINDIGYYTISWYIIYTVTAIILFTFLIRLLRAFPFYVKNGNMGNAKNSLFLNGSNYKEMLRNFFTETHPTTVMEDFLVCLFSMFLLFVGWGFIPGILIALLIWSGVGRLANHMREQYLKEQAFHASLKGE